MKTEAKAELEIERKYFFEDEASLKRALTQQGYAFSGEGKETDLYFSDGSGEYIRNRTCLRFRTKEGRDILSIDYKGKSETLTGGFAKRETNILQPITNIGPMEELLTHLGFYRYVEVVKTRETFRRRQEGYIENIVFDRLEGIGNFLEIELIAPTGHGSLPELQKALQYREKELIPYGLCPADVPYRDFAAWTYRKKLGDSPFKTIILDLDPLFGFSERNLDAASFHEATGNAFNAANIHALREMAGHYRMRMVSKLSADLLAPWFQKSGVGLSKLSFVQEIGPCLTEERALVITKGETAYKIPTVQIGGNLFQHLMQAHLLLTYAEPCEIEQKTETHAQTFEAEG